MEGIAREVFDRHYVGAALADESLGPTRAVDRYAQPLQRVNDGAQAFLVVDGDEGGFNFPFGHAAVLVF